MKKVLILLFIMTLVVSAKDYTKHSKTISVMNTLVKKHGFERSYLKKLFSNVKVQKSALRAFTPRKKQKRRKDTRTPEQIAKAKSYYNKYGPWERYSRYIVSQKRVDQGVAVVFTAV